MTTRPSTDARRVLFVLVVLGCALVSAVYVFKAATRSRATAQAPRTAEIVAPGELPRPAGPLLLFSNLVPQDNLRYHVGLVPLATPDGPRGLADLVCERVYFAGGRGLCLGAGGGTAPLLDSVTATHAYIFGSDFRVTHDIALGGVPSRVRVSPDGRHGAATVFVTGHSYADANFSTATTLIDLERGRALGNLETFTVWRDGRPFHAVDFNFWGVTFAPDGDRFYASLRTGGRTYLVEGSVSARRMQTLRENVECPSLSPDATRLAFKKRIGSSGWRFHVLDLASMQETPLAERRSLDDQIEWLDSRQVLYGDGNGIWVTDADGSGAPRKLASQAASPAVIGADAADGISADVATTGLRLPVADLAIGITSSAHEVRDGAQVTYTITVTNQGPADASMLKVDQILAPGLTSVSSVTATNPGHGYACSRYEDPSHLSCDTPLLARGDVWTMSFSARVTSSATTDLQATVSAAESDPVWSNDRAEIRTAPADSVKPRDQQ